MPVGNENEESHAEPPPTWVAWTSLGLLLVSLVAVVGLAKALAPALDAGVVAAGLPHAVVGVVIAMIVLLPETGAALRALNVPNDAPLDNVIAPPADIVAEEV